MGKSKLIENKGKAVTHQLDEKDQFYNGLALHGVSVADIKSLKTAGIFNADDLKKHTTKKLSVKGLSHHQLETICEASGKLLDKKSSDSAANKSPKSAKKKDFSLDPTAENSSSSLRKVVAEEGPDHIDNEHAYVAARGFLYVSGLPADIRDHEINHFFSDCGIPRKRSVVRTPKGGCKGYLFLEYDSPNSIATALRLSGNTIRPGVVVSVVVGRRSGRTMGVSGGPLRQKRKGPSGYPY